MRRQPRACWRSHAGWSFHALDSRAMLGMGARGPFVMASKTTNQLFGWMRPTSLSPTCPSFFSVVTHL